LPNPTVQSVWRDTEQLGHLDRRVSLH
jgi:hypothetical protein